MKKDKLYICKKTIIDINFVKHDVNEVINDKFAKDIFVNALGGPDVFSSMVEEDIIDFKAIESEYKNLTILRMLMVTTANMDYKRNIDKSLLEIGDIIKNYNDTEQKVKLIISSKIKTVISIMPDGLMHNYSLAHLSSYEHSINGIKGIAFYNNYDDKHIKTDFEIELSINNSVNDNIRLQNELVDMVDEFIKDMV